MKVALTNVSREGETPFSLHDLVWLSWPPEAGVVDGVAMRGEPQGRKWGRRAVVLLPCVWLAVFFLTPFVIVLKISLSQAALAQPPIRRYSTRRPDGRRLRFCAAVSLELFRIAVPDLIYLLSYSRVFIAAISTLIWFWSDTPSPTASPARPAAGSHCW